MDKESGVYFTVTDNSIQTSGASTLKVLVPMLTVKGEIGLNYVTADTYKDVLGYDLSYNSNYEGLARILEKVSYAYVWRINQNAKLGNAYFANTSSEKESREDCDNFDEIVNIDPSPILAVANKDVGDPGAMAVKFTPKANVETIINENPVSSMPQIIKLEDVSETETESIDGVEIKSGCKIYNSSNNSLIAVIKPNYDNELKVYKVSDGKIIDDVITVDTINTWTDGTNFFNSAMQLMDEPAGTPGTPVVLGNVRNGQYDVINDAWQIAGESVYYNEDMRTFVPVGTKGSEVIIGEVYIADGSESHLIQGHWYITNDLGSTYYEISKLGETWADTVKVQVTESESITELNDLYTGTQFKNLGYYPFTEQVYTGMYKKDANEWFKVVAFTTTLITTVTSAETDENIIAILEAASDIEISYVQYINEYVSVINSIGIAQWEDGNLILTLTAKPSRDSFWNFRTIPTIIEDWIFSVAENIDNNYVIKNTYDISTNPDAENFWKKVEISDAQLFIASSIPSDWKAVRDYITLDNGSNGDKTLVSADLDTTVLEHVSVNVIAMNGITDVAILNRIASRAKDFFIHTFGDAPAFSSYIDLSSWMKTVTASEYLAIGARPDQVAIDNAGNTVLVYPSVNYVAILSNMLASFGSLCYPPAGASYGSISVENLIECDYDKYGNELKTERINWQRAINRGTAMWEQRTTYGLNSDLSYIAPTFIVDEVRERLVAFEQDFTFRYMSATDLLNQESGISNILYDLQSKGFLYSYKVKMPTYEEAVKAGRTLTIPIEIIISKDSEVININVAINNLS